MSEQISHTPVEDVTELSIEAPGKTEVVIDQDRNLAGIFVSSCLGMYDSLKSYWQTQLDQKGLPPSSADLDTAGINRRVFLRLTLAAATSAIVTALNVEEAQARPIYPEDEDIAKEKVKNIKELEEAFDLPFAFSKSIYEAAENYKSKHEGQGLDAKYIAAVARWEHRGTSKKEYEKALKDTFPVSPTRDYGPFQINERWFKEPGALRITAKEANDPVVSAKWATVVLNYLYDHHWDGRIHAEQTEKQQIIKMYELYNGSREYGEATYTVSQNGLKVPEN
ncbi:MAG: hypothetical protein M3Q44_03555 [bacterium]|nr:hypothetical protein [bacterium]